MPVPTAITTVLPDLVTTAATTAASVSVQSILTQRQEQNATHYIQKKPGRYTVGVTLNGNIESTTNSAAPLSPYSLNQLQSITIGSESPSAAVEQLTGRESKWTEPINTVTTVDEDNESQSNNNNNHSSTVPIPIHPLLPAVSVSLLSEFNQHFNPYRNNANINNNNNHNHTVQLPITISPKRPNNNNNNHPTRTKSKSPRRRPRNRTIFPDLLSKSSATITDLDRRLEYYKSTTHRLNSINIQSDLQLAQYGSNKSHTLFTTVISPVVKRETDREIKYKLLSQAKYKSLNTIERLSLLMGLMRPIVKAIVKRRELKRQQLLTEAAERDKRKHRELAIQQRHQRNEQRRVHAEQAKIQSELTELENRRRSVSDSKRKLLVSSQRAAAASIESAEQIEYERQQLAYDIAIKQLEQECRSIELSIHQYDRQQLSNRIKSEQNRQLELSAIERRARSKQLKQQVELNAKKRLQDQQELLKKLAAEIDLNSSNSTVLPINTANNQTETARLLHNLRLQKVAQLQQQQLQQSNNKSTVVNNSSEFNSILRNKKVAL